MNKREAIKAWAEGALIKVHDITNYNKDEIYYMNDDGEICSTSTSEKYSVDDFKIDTDEYTVISFSKEKLQMHKNKIFYVSHPFTGTQDEQEWNQQEARATTAKLKQDNPNNIFINPLDAFQYAMLVSEWNYDDILGQCLELLKKCDGIIMTGDWKKSNGCQREKKLAERLGLEIWEFKCYGINVQDIYK